MDPLDLVILLHCAKVLLHLSKKKRLKTQFHLSRAAKRFRIRRFYVREINRDRARYGEIKNIVERMRELDEKQHFEYFRMSKETFDELLALIEPRIRHANTHASPVSPRERLALTLRILATGDSQASVAHSYCLGRPTVNRIFRETVKVIWEVLAPVYLPPCTEEKWAENARQFEEAWDYPNCIGAIDGKHVVMKKPNNAGSQDINYKGTHSLVLMAVAGPNYEFVYADIGGHGRQSDGGTWSNCSLGRALNSGSLQIPPPRRPSGCPHMCLLRMQHSPCPTI